MANEVKTSADITVKRDRTVKKIDIILPEDMNLKAAIEWLKKKDADDEKAVNVLHELDCFPLDGAVAFFDSLAEIYGFVEKADTPGMWRDNPPVLIGVPTGPKDSKQVPWGRVQIPNIEGFLNTGYNANPFPKFVISGTVKQRHLPEIQAIVEKTKDQLRRHSIYKGKAVELDLEWLRDKDDFDPIGHAPKFTIPLEGVSEEQLIFPDQVAHDIRTGLFTPLDHPNFCKRMGIPVKRGVLMFGPYGCGKSMTAWVCATKCVAQGRTFIYLKSVLDLAMAFQFARQYAPAMIFAEDLDTVISDQQSKEMVELRNAFDGVVSKTSDIITVLTTNHLDKLDPSLLRPGRCDLLVHVSRPDAKAAIRLVQQYGCGLLADDVNYEVIGEALDGHLPAEIREAVERSKMACIARQCLQGKVDEDTATVKGMVTHEDILNAVRALDLQHQLLLPKPKDERGVIEKIVDQMADRFANHGNNKPARAAAAVAHELGINGDRLRESVRNGG